ncbi:MAG: hypothetical protein R2755_13755 [Acidimicrobiales bacterium]
MGLAYQASRTGGTAAAWLNGANEAVVAAFLAGRIGWIDIAEVLKAVMDRHDGGKAQSVDDVVDADRTARRLAEELVVARS